MEIFNTHRRDILDFDNYMDLKKPGFGGPKSAIALRDARGNKIEKNPKLSGYQRTVERDPAFSHPVYNSTYKAMTHDLVYKQEKKKPYTYTDPYRTAVPVIEYDPTDEGKSYSSFERFVNENEERSLVDIVKDLESYEKEGDGEGEEDYGYYGANPKAKHSDLPAFPAELGEPDEETMKYLQQKADEFGANPRFRRVVDRTTGEEIGNHSYGEGFVPNARGMELGHTEHPTLIPNRTRFDDRADADDMMRDDRWDKEMNRRMNLRRRDLE